LRIRLRSPAAVRARVAPELLHETLVRLTELETPLAVRVAISGEILALTTHDPEQGWFATMAVRVAGTTPARRTAAVTVDLLLLREIVEYSRLATSAGADAIVTVRDGRAVGLSRWSVRASRVTPAIEVPPGPGGWVLLAEGCALPHTTEREGTTTFAIPDATVTARNAVLERMTRRGLDVTDLYEADGRVFLVATGSEEPDRALSLIGAARVVYSGAVDD